MIVANKLQLLAVRGKALLRRHRRLLRQHRLALGLLDGRRPVLVRLLGANAALDVLVQELVLAPHEDFRLASKPGGAVSFFSRALQLRVQRCSTSFSRS